MNGRWHASSKSTAAMKSRYVNFGREICNETRHLLRSCHDSPKMGASENAASNKLENIRYSLRSRVAKLDHNFNYSNILRLLDRCMSSIVRYNETLITCSFFQNIVYLILVSSLGHSQPNRTFLSLENSLSSREIK